MKNKPLPSDEEAILSFRPPPPPTLDDRIHPKETELTLLLGCAMKIYFAFRLTDAAIKRAEDLMLQYIMLYKKVSTCIQQCM